MSLNNIAEEFTKKVEELRKEYTIKFAEFNKEYTKVIFDNCPNIVEVAAVGYTPYFNDGDVCEHYMQEPKVKLDVDVVWKTTYSDYHRNITQEVEECESAGDWIDLCNIGEPIDAEIARQLRFFEENSDIFMNSHYSDLFETVVGTNTILCMCRDGSSYTEGNWEHD